MRKFKHEQTGWIAESCEMVSNHYELRGYKTVTRIPSEFIENSKEWVEIFEPKFKNGDVIIDEDGTIILITDFENEMGYGFSDDGKWYCNSKWNFANYLSEYRLATQEKWLEALTNEAVKNGLIKDNYALFGTSKHKRKIKLTEYRLNEEGYLCNGTNILMKNGIWADVVKEETLEELGVRFEDFYINYKGTLAQAHKEFFTENKETFHRLSK